ncbi:MAG TPA: site-2 protease family protein [Blastocatellia bacterium]|nr:site-2 protease family protein [Blastocatellia bacterium]
MESQIKLGKVFGIEIGLHFSWLLIAFLIALSLASHFRETHPAWTSGLIWGMAIITAVLFFASIVAHELSHALVARWRGVPVHSITLFALGGVAKLEKDSEDAQTEFLVSIVGPLMSFAIGFMCLILAFVTGWSPMSEPATPLMSMLVWLGYINIGLAVFNLIPGFPMDGGRVLRAVVWWITGNARKAMRVAAVSGQVVAFCFIVYGIWRFFSGAGFSGLWMAFIGWFLMSAAKAAYVQQEMTDALRNVHVGELMVSDCSVVEGHLNLQTFVHDYLLHTGRRCFLIVENGEISGLITPNEVKNVSQAKWPYTTIYDVMRPLSEMRTVTPETPVSEALELLAKEDINQLPVVINGRLQGLISRDRILRYLTTRAELNV